MHSHAIHRVPDAFSSKDKLLSLWLLVLFSVLFSVLLSVLNASQYALTCTLFDIIVKSLAALGSAAKKASLKLMSEAFLN